VDFEDEAGVVVESAAEIGREGKPADIDAVAREALGTPLEEIDRLADVEFLGPGKRAKRFERRGFSPAAQAALPEAPC